MARFKIVLPSDTTEWFEAIMWNTREPVRMNDLMNKVRQTVNCSAEKLILYFWDGFGYSRLGEDSDLEQAVRGSHHTKEGSIIRIYVVQNKANPLKVYGKPPYDNIFEAPNITGSHDNKSCSISAKHKESKGNKQHRISAATVQEMHDQLISQQRPKPSSLDRRSVDRMPAANFATSSAPSIPCQVSSSGRAELPYEVDSAHTEEADLNVAVATLRAMGYGHDTSILQFYIQETSGDLNEIIDRLQLHSTD